MALNRGTIGVIRAQGSMRDKVFLSGGNQGRLPGERVLWFHP